MEGGGLSKFEKCINLLEVGVGGEVNKPQGQFGHLTQGWRGQREHMEVSRDSG